MKYYILSITMDYEKDYSKLFEAINGLGENKFLSNTTWVVACNSSAREIRSYLKNFIDYLDEIIVAEITINMAWYLNRKDGDGLQRRQDLLDNTLFNDESITM